VSDGRGETSRGKRKVVVKKEEGGRNGGLSQKKTPVNDAGKHVSTSKKSGEAVAEEKRARGLVGS